MKTMIKVPALILLMLLGLMACKKDKRVDDAVADVYVKSMSVDGQIEYALAHYVLGQSSIATVTVSMPDATIGHLSTYDNSNTLFYLEPTTNSSYSATLPPSGTYTYTVRFDDGVEKTVTDVLGSGCIAPPNITTLSKSDDGTKLMMRWDPLTGAEYYRYFISKDGTAIYNSNLFSLANTSDNYIEIPTYLISSYLNGTQTYTIELAAFKYQSLDDGKIESASTTTTQIVL